ncbi:CPBP family intramembrane glutamic endopeptidase [Cellvibrio sp.]|uniref:CPBP family intramembrane glutamic endopeptidase n=1 Tax=Cellvibrio sp. TaxID=1965322 RepID=UPI00374FB077
MQIPGAHIERLNAVAIGTLLAIVTFLLFAVIYRFGGKFAQSLLNDTRRVSGIFSSYSWMHLACVATLAGVGEELLFRGFLQIWLSNHFTITWAILIASIIFGLLHYLSHAYFISVTLMSIAFGVAYYITDSLLMVMVWHGVYDFIALFVLIKYQGLMGVDSVNES